MIQSEYDCVAMSSSFRTDPSPGPFLHSQMRWYTIDTYNIVVRQIKEQRKELEVPPTVSSTLGTPACFPFIHRVLGAFQLSNDGSFKRVVDIHVHVRFFSDLADAINIANIWHVNLLGAQ